MSRSSSLRLIGAHTIDNGGIHMAVRRAGAAGMTALQVFTAIPKYYNEKVSVRPERVQRFRDALAATAIEPRNVVSHAAYVLNVATAETEKWDRASAGLARELARSTALGIGAVCFHPGAATDGDRAAAAERVSRAIVSALEAVDGETRLLVENTAGSGRTMGKSAAEVGEILDRVPPSLRARTGYGLDTCHLFVAGHDVAASPASLAAILDEFEAATGEPPSFFHLNDSEGGLGSARDRHALIGEGTIGVEPFRWLLAEPRSCGIPLVLETPQQHPTIADDDPSPDPYDLRMMELLRGLAP
ncbi:MAG TPA: deoxyribonuclease IV [Gemmatimonadaceae bacterium]|nr:deoxyribonuclease IV [Gemmatimonadaceae bacterium]